MHKHRGNYTIKNKRIYALYRGEENICDGTLAEIAAKTGMDRDLISKIKRDTQRMKDNSNCTGMMVFEIEGCEEDELLKEDEAETDSSAKERVAESSETKSQSR